MGLIVQTDVDSYSVWPVALMAVPIWGNLEIVKTSLL